MVEQRREFPGAADAISDIRDFVRDGCRSVWDRESDGPLIAQLELAVSETASNIILHGLQQEHGAQIDVSLQPEATQVCVTLRYTGCAFSRTVVPPPDFGGLSESGYGLYLIEQSVDDVVFSRSDQGQCTIRLVKQRR